MEIHRRCGTGRYGSKRPARDTRGRSSGRCRRRRRPSRARVRLLRSSTHASGQHGRIASPTRRAGARARSTSPCGAAAQSRGTVCHLRQRRPRKIIDLGIFHSSPAPGYKVDCLPIIPTGPPDVEGGRSAGPARSRRRHADRPGDDHREAALDATGLSRRHLLLVSDGENTDGYRPEDVAAAIAKRPDAEKPSIYFVAFDIEARRFNGVRDAGGLVLPASNAKELNETLDGLIQGKILWRNNSTPTPTSSKRLCYAVVPVRNFGRWPLGVQRDRFSQDSPD